MESDCGWQEHLCDSLMEGEGSVNYVERQFLDGRGEVCELQVLTQHTVVYRDYGLVVREADCEHTEVSLKHIAT